MTAPSKRLSVRPVAAALRSNRGNVAAVARQFGVTRQSAHGFIRARPALLEVLAECKETMLDVTEAVLENAILAGDLSAVRYYLSTQGRSRGYVERHEHSGPDGGPIAITTVEAVLPPD